MPTDRRIPVLLAAAVFLAGTLLGTRPSPRPRVLGLGLEWTVTRTVRRARFTAVARELSRSVADAARATEPGRSRGRRDAGASRPLSDVAARPESGGRRDVREASLRPHGSTRLRC